MLSDKVKIELIKAAPKVSHIELIELVAEECQRAQRQWIGLTDEEKNAITWGNDIYKILELAEAKLKEKNT